ncbi:hypothetical protein ES703_117710 [subsurface metagenome]
MKELNSPPKFLIYAVLKALRHPKTPITYFYCSSCKIRFNAKEPECPQCHEKVGSSPDPKQESPIPWYGSVGVIILGIACWVVGGIYQIPGLDEAGRALVYIPLGSLFGMSLHR